MTGFTAATPVSERWSQPPDPKTAAVVGMSCCRSSHVLSPGESVSRANMHLAGFPAPVIQQAFTDGGRFVARTDFFWKEAGLVGEFDGLAKYSRGEYLEGRIPEDVLAAGKIREDKLRAMGLRVCRWTWKTALDRELLSDQLIRARRQPARRPARIP